MIDRVLSPPAPLRVLLWHFGKRGAGPKFAGDLAMALNARRDVCLTVSASNGSELAAVCAAEKVGPALRVLDTFDGDKGTWIGKVKAALALATLPRLASQFTTVLAERRPQVVVCAFQSIWDAATFRAIRRHGGHFVLVLHDAAFHPGDGYPMRTHVLERQVKAADFLVVLSDHVGRQATQIYGFPSHRIRTVPHGSFVFGAKREMARKAPLNRPFRLLFLGRIVAYKGLDLLLAAYGIARRRGLNVQLAIAGDGNMAPYARTLEGLADVEVTNRWLEETDIASALDRADLVVLPYVEASQSGVAASAFAAALPVVATPVGGLSEQVEHEVTGLIASDVTAEAVADALERFVRDPTFYAACSANALSHAATLDWDAVAARILAVLQDAIRIPRRGTPS